MGSKGRSVAISRFVPSRLQSFENNTDIHQEQIFVSLRRQQLALGCLIFLTLKKSSGWVRSKYAMCPSRMSFLSTLTIVPPVALNIDVSCLFEWVTPNVANFQKSSLTESGNQTRIWRLEIQYLPKRGANWQSCYIDLNTLDVVLHINDKHS